MRTSTDEMLVQGPNHGVVRRQSEFGRWRSRAFQVGDALFLAGIGALSTWTMHMTHESGWPFAICAIVGMLAAMLVQTVAAWLIAPLLGSIESMVPSMAVAMVCPMSVCALHLLGCEPGPLWSVTQGAALGLGIFGFVAGYGHACRRRFKVRPQTAGWGA